MDIWKDIYVENEDATTFMKKIPDGKIDFVWTDPPYNVGKNYGVYTDNLSDESYLMFCENWIREAKRVSNNRMAIYVPTKYKLEYWNMLGKDYKEVILGWSPEGAYRYGFINQHATILTNAKPLQRTKDLWMNYQVLGLGYFFREDNYDHPGYTSEHVTKKVITSFTEIEQTVLDPFTGTGTTVVCCHDLNRKFVGCEIDPKWFEIIQKRIEGRYMQPSLI